MVFVLSARNHHSSKDYLWTIVTKQIVSVGCFVQTVTLVLANLARAWSFCKQPLTTSDANNANGHPTLSQ